MLMRSDFDVNISQRYVKDFLKRTIITQEVMFRNQVNELHRLYITQKSLMKYIECQEFGQYTSGRLGPQATLMPEGGFTGSLFQQRPLDLQSSANEYINYNGREISNKRNETRVHFPEEVNLSLSIGSSCRSKNKSRKSWNNRVNFSQDIIDLERSTEEESTETKKSVKMFDLNKSQLDDSVFQSIQGNLSMGTSTGDYSALFGSSHGSSCSTRTCLEEPKTVCSIDLESMSGPQLDLSDGAQSDGRPSDSSQLAKTPSQEDFMGSSEESEIKNSCFDQKKKEAMEMDYTTQRAALSLLSISLQETSTNDQGCIFKSSSNPSKVEETKVKVKPQHSMDSYESLVLNLKESNEEDECVSSKPFDPDQMDKKECGVKLRRGRRLKDFQKDVLPSLSTLSRQEIWEDINIIQGVIRSREYKKLRAQASITDNLFTPVRSKRSRLGYVGKRYS